MHAKLTQIPWHLSGVNCIFIPLNFFPGLARQLSKSLNFSLEVDGLALHVFGRMDYLGVVALYAVHAAEGPGGNLTQHLVLPAGSWDIGTGVTVYLESRLAFASSM